MPQTPTWSRYLDAGAEFVAVTRDEARRRAADLVSQGQLAQEQVQSFVDGLMEESRKRTEATMDLVRKEVRRQIKSLGIVTKSDLAKLEARLTKEMKRANSKAGKATKKPAKSKSTKKATGKKGAGKSKPAAATSPDGA
jgi:polyhydroxyalkanoate synthesis regulator phasin